MIHLAAFCTLSGAVQGAWMYFAGNPFRTGKYFLKTIKKIVHFRTDSFFKVACLNPALHHDAVCRCKLSNQVAVQNSS